MLYSFFQTQNSMLIQKTIKPVDKFSKKTKEEKDESTHNQNETTSTRSSAANTATAIATVAATSTIDDYRIKREKNNESVRKSRAKNRVKLQECAVRVKELKTENVELNNKLSNLQTELFTLRGLFQYCFSFNSNQMQVKPSEIPTSSLYKIIMQNKAKFLAPSIEQASLPVTSTNALSSQALMLPITGTSQSVNEIKASLTSSTNVTTAPQSPTMDNIDAMLEQSRLLSLNDPVIDTSSNSKEFEFDFTLQQQTPVQQQQQQQPNVFDDKDEFFINELKQSLIEFIKYEDGSVTNTTVNSSPLTSSVSSPMMSSSSPATPQTPSLNANNGFLLDDEITIDNTLLTIPSSNSNHAIYLDDHDYSIKRTRYNF